MRSTRRFGSALGFLPMVLSSTSGAEVQRRLATVVIGGLVSATLLKLLIIPTLYAWVVRRSPMAVAESADDA